MLPSLTPDHLINSDRREDEACRCCARLQGICSMAQALDLDGMRCIFETSFPAKPSLERLIPSLPWLDITMTSTFLCELATTRLRCLQNIFLLLHKTRNWHETFPAPPSSTRWRPSFLVAARKWPDSHISLSLFVYLQGGEVVQETITSNIHDDIITLEFQRTDGTLITQLIDFRSVSTRLSTLSGCPLAVSKPKSRMQRSTLLTLLRASRI